MADPVWTIIVHGGAKTIAPAKAEANREGCRAAADAGAAILREGGSAIDAAVTAIRILEDDPTFNAGRGSVRNAACEIEMDAAIMDGATLAIGAVAGVKRIRNPIAVAHAMLAADPILLIAEGAEQFALEHGFEFESPVIQQSPAEAGHDTVGCVALDIEGHIAAATSTGGVANMHPGRVGDSPMPGCGFYADDGTGGVSLSGDGEAIARTMLAARIMHSMEADAAKAAVQAIHAPLARVGGEAGAIAIDSAGRIGIAHNSDHFALGLASRELAPKGGIKRDEFKELLKNG
jgi:L-asparaginase / beta-aspartyl-peptidase